VEQALGNAGIQLCVHALADEGRKGSVEVEHEDGVRGAIKEWPPVGGRKGRRRQRDGG
jgi:hypothetical protein